MLPDPDKRLITSLFLGTALSISSVKIVAMVVREMNFMRRTRSGHPRLGHHRRHHRLDHHRDHLRPRAARRGRPAGVRQSVHRHRAFCASLRSAAALVFLMIRWANDNFVSELPVITTILVIMGVMALTTH